MIGEVLIGGEGEGERRRGIERGMEEGDSLRKAGPVSARACARSGLLWLQASDVIIYLFICWLVGWLSKQASNLRFDFTCLIIIVFMFIFVFVWTCCETCEM